MASCKGPIIPNDFTCLCYLHSNIALPRYYTKEQFYRQAVQYADKAVGVDKAIIVFSAPYRAHGKKTNTIVRWECKNVSSCSTVESEDIKNTLLVV